MPAGGETRGQTWRVNVWSVARPAASVARTVKLKLPDVVGVPLNTPAELSAKPGGGLPVTTKYETGDVAEIEVKVCE